MKYEIEVKFFRGQLFYGNMNNVTTPIDGAREYLGRSLNNGTVERFYAIPMVAMGNRRNNNNGGKLSVAIYRVSAIEKALDKLEKGAPRGFALGIRNNVVKVVATEKGRVLSTFGRPIKILDTDFASLDDVRDNGKALYNGAARGFEFIVADAIRKCDGVNKVYHVGDFRPGRNNSIDLIQSCDVVVETAVPFDFII